MADAHLTCRERACVDPECPWVRAQGPVASDDLAGQEAALNEARARWRTVFAEQQAALRESANITERDLALVIGPGDHTPAPPTVTLEREMVVQLINVLRDTWSSWPSMRHNLADRLAAALEKSR